jgi:hypothetical protein
LLCLFDFTNFSLFAKKSVLTKQFPVEWPNIVGIRPSSQLSALHIPFVPKNLDINPFFSNKPNDSCQHYFYRFILNQIFCSGVKELISFFFFSGNNRSKQLSKINFQ